MNHASSCHPESIYFLAKIQDESMTNVNLSWLNEEKVKFLKKMSYKQYKILVLHLQILLIDLDMYIGILQKNIDFLPKNI